MIYLSKQTCVELGAEADEDIVFNDFSCVSSPEERALLERARDHGKASEDCPECNRNFEPGGDQIVCDEHWHDYNRCSKRTCLSCVILNACWKYFPENERWSPYR